MRLNNPFTKRPEARCTVFRLEHIHTTALELTPEGATHVLVIVDDQYRCDIAHLRPPKYTLTRKQTLDKSEALDKCYLNPTRHGEIPKV